MTLQEYALIQDGQIVDTNMFKRPDLVPETGLWRIVGEVTPDFDATTRRLGEKTLTLLEDGSVAYVWSLTAIPRVVRERVSKAALKTAAGQMGLLGKMDDFIARHPFDAPAVIRWLDASDFKRSDILWNFFDTELALSSEEVDNLFNMAGQYDDVFG